MNNGTAFDPVGEARRRWDAHEESEPAAAMAAASSMTSLIDGLEKSGYIWRPPHAHDREE